MLLPRARAVFALKKVGIRERPRPVIDGAVHVITALLAAHPQALDDLLVLLEDGDV
jgi:hypothetical protein